MKDFGNDDTPVYRVNSKLMGRIETLFSQRSKRQATYNIMEPLKVPVTMDESSLKDLVHKFSQQTGKSQTVFRFFVRNENLIIVVFQIKHRKLSLDNCSRKKTLQPSSIRLYSTNCCYAE